MKGFRWRQTTNHRLQIPTGLHSTMLFVALIGLLTVFGTDIIEDYAPKWVEIIVAITVAVSWLGVMGTEPYSAPEED